MRTKKEKDISKLFVAKHIIPNIDEEVRKKAITQTIINYINEMELLENPNSNIRYYNKADWLNKIVMV